MPLVERYLIDDVLLARKMTLLVPALLAYGGLWLLLELLFASMNILNSYLSERIAMYLRQRVFDHCQSMSFTCINRDHSSRLVALFSNDVPQVAGFFNGVVVTSVVSLTTLLVGVIIVIRINWQFGLAVLIIVPVAIPRNAESLRNPRFSRAFTSKITSCEAAPADRAGFRR